MNPVRSPVRLLMIAPQPFFTPRGTPFSVYYRARALAALGHRIDLVTYPIGKDVRIPGVKVHRSISVPFIHSVKVGPSFKKLILDIFLFWKSFWMLTRHRYEVVHVHEEAAFFCLPYRLLFKIKVIYDMHSSLPEQLRNFRFSGSRLLAGIFEKLEAAVLSRADLVITICPRLQDKVNREYPDVPSVLIENTLCDPIDFPDTVDELNSQFIRWEYFSSRKVIFYSGTFEFYQGIPLLVKSVPRVVRKYPDALFVLVGGSREQVKKMRTLARDLGVREHILFTGTLHPNTVKHLLAKADVLVSPRFQGSNSPLKIYEYLASGKPIVATRHPVHTQVLGDAEAVLTQPDEAAFAEGILSVLGDPEKQKAMGLRAKDRYNRAYGEASYSAKVLEGMAYVA